MRKNFRKTKKIKKKGSLLKSRFFWLGVSIAALVEFLFSIIVIFPPFQIQEVRVGGNTEISENTIKNVALHNLWREFLFFPTASIVLVDTRQMQESLLGAIVELDTVSIQRKFPSTLVISVQEKKTVALWCKDTCFALDKHGVAFKKTDLSSDFPIIDSLRETPANLREAVIAKNALFAVLDFSREIKRRSLLLGDEAGVHSFTIISESQINANVSEGWRIYFSQTQDLSWQIAKLQTVLENKIPPEKRKKLEYVDVRFGDQAYVKYR